MKFSTKPKKFSLATLVNICFTYFTLMEGPAKTLPLAGFALVGPVNFTSVYINLKESYDNFNKSFNPVSMNLRKFRVSIVFACLKMVLLSFNES